MERPRRSRAKTTTAWKSPRWAPRWSCSQAGRWRATALTVSSNTYATAKPRAREVNLAAGLLVPVALETTIDSKSASVGDAVHARVRQDVRQKGQLVLPAGALISGRIRSLDRYTSPEPYCLMGIEFSEAEWQNARAEFLAELVESHDRKAVRPGHGTLQTPGVGILHIPGGSFHLAPGFRMLWRTLGQQPASGFR